MSRDMKFFMRAHKEEIVKVLGPETLLDDKGERITMEIRVLGQKDIQQINDNYKIRTMATDNKGQPYIAMDKVVWKEEKDSAKAARHMIVEALVYPNLKDPDLMKFYNCVDVTDMPLHVFPRADEYAYIQRVVMSALGLGAAIPDDQLISEAKN